ncbi:hypothetical protein D3C72_2283840 [compost metagenome]
MAVDRSQQFVMISVGWRHGQLLNDLIFRMGKPALQVFGQLLGLSRKRSVDLLLGDALVAQGFQSGESRTYFVALKHEGVDIRLVGFLIFQGLVGEMTPR